jgi:hypothetical protein
MIQGVIGRNKMRRRFACSPRALGEAKELEVVWNAKE